MSSALSPHNTIASRFKVRSSAAFAATQLNLIRISAISIGYLVCAGNIGGVIGSYIYIDKEAPRYPTGYGNSLAFASAGIVAMLLLEFLLWSANKRNAYESEEAIRERFSPEQLEKMGDRSPLFRYRL
ncbi:hypothetical protein LQW54_001188 [Pestalotiopsis sp. IQ-011]